MAAVSRPGGLRTRASRALLDPALVARRAAGARTGRNPLMSARDRLFLSPHWHVDCRLVAELPEDSVVGIRFITYAVSCAVALAAVLFTGWYAYADLSLRRQIEDASLRLEDDHWEVVEIRRLQHFYENASKQIESAYSEMKNPILISGFMSSLGRILPDRMVVDGIQYGDGKILVRGRLRE